MSLKDKTVASTVRSVVEGKLRCTDIVEHYADVITQSESDINAWEHYDRELALQTAKQLDSKKHDKPLYGIPVGLKDIFDTADFPTEHGSPIHTGRRPAQDCAVAELLKSAGAIIMGKTVTTEFAFFNPSKTRNPLNTDYSPGGSSSGSAAAVAAGHIPLAVGSQTNGSVIRPASFCGVYGFKPTRGLVSRRGVLETSTTLDHVGFFARNLEDIATLSDVVSSYDAADNASYSEPRHSLVEHLKNPSGSQPSVAWFDMPYSERYSDDARDVFENLLTTLEGSITRIDAPAEFKTYLDAHKAIYDYEIVRALDNEISNHWLNISETARPIFEASKNRTEAQYLEALKIRESAIEWFDSFYKQHDAILTPSALAEAPLMGSTGDPVCCTIWTLCGLPCINLPILNGKNNLPIGVQLVGPLKQDHLLLDHAKQLLTTLESKSI